MACCWRGLLFALAAVVVLATGEGVVVFLAAVVLTATVVEEVEAEAGAEAGGGATAGPGEGVASLKTPPTASTT